MTEIQQQAFYDAAGFYASSLSFDVRLFAGGFTIVCAILILAGLMHLLNSNSSWDKTVFILSIFGLSFVVMLLFIYIA